MYVGDVSQNIRDIREPFAFLGGCLSENGQNFHFFCFMV